ncbi:MAG: phosphoribosylformylglycinamidine synthase [Clostridia bacterium]|nr:phosphoribosylformylglycinamidine synthase [Clostridia bacterium]
MKMEVKRIYVKKKEGFNVEAKGVLSDLKENLQIENIKNLEIYNRYDVFGISQETFEKAKNTIFSEPQVDDWYTDDIPLNKYDMIFGIESLPGQFDQRASSLSECLQIISEDTKPISRTAKVYVLSGNLLEEDVKRIKKYLINPVDSREASLDKLETLEEKAEEPADITVCDGFINMTDEDSEEFYKKYGFAMDLADLKFCKNYFKNVEKRDPTITEMKMIDTYWSDHCRHTTFLTKLEVLDIKWDLLQRVYEEYIKSRAFVYENKKAKDVCLMDIATVAVKELKKKGLLKDLDESEEINACSIKAEIVVDGKPEEYLIMFKNETHNHPTEIEPFGGASTCLGGAIRDPLSGRVYVYQAMRVTGCADPRTPVKDTLPNKLPQRKITTEAARGYSSYGNQIGLATGQVAEIYDEGYVAKRLELGALIGAAPAKNVIRLRPEPGDKVVLLGGRTGRDGLGGATGSSKAHNSNSLSSCGAEVQKGNAPEERKIQRLFRNSEATKLIKRCNDFGAGGVSVAIGELADGLEINLDKIPKKYEGLDGTELAISESQERMAVVVANKDVQKFINLAETENIEATVVAEITKEARVKMYWRGKLIVDISREFLDTNGTVKEAQISVSKPNYEKSYFTKKESKNIEKSWKDILSDLNVCSQKGLVERFDSTIGANTVLMPFGGKYQLTPSEGMVARIPTLEGYTDDGTIMTYGYNPKIAKWSAFHGSVYAIVESVSKFVAIGGDYKKSWLTLQEFFEKLGNNPERWGKPFAALLGAYYVQEKLNIAAIGGKDSMSGSYNELDVPPTLVSFTVGTVDITKVVSNEFKKSGSKVVLLKTKMDDEFMLDFEELKENYELVHSLIDSGKVLSCSTIRHGGIAEVISKACFGNKLGFELSTDINVFEPMYGSFVLELAEDVSNEKFIELGSINETKKIISKNLTIDLDEALKIWEEPLEKIFPTKTEITKQEKIENTVSDKNQVIASKVKIAKPRVFIPVFPGTNCEYDVAKAFENAGAITNTVVFKNTKSNDVKESIEAFAKAIAEAQIIMIPGGFSSGDEPEGSAKFIGAVFRNEKLKEEISKLLYNRDGLMLGICNGFQALVKLGLVPYGKIIDMKSNMPTLTFNDIGRHQSRIVNTKVVSKLSPWLAGAELGKIYNIPISHGEGKFIVTQEEYAKLKLNGQIATEYVDFEGNPTYNIDFNPNGSNYAIEGITSPDGRVFGKMGHSERVIKDIMKNIPGQKDQKLFESGVNYYN